MAAIHIVQIAHLSQELIEHIIQVNNLITRSKHELDRIHQVTKMLVNVHVELEMDLGYAQQFR